MPVEHISQSAAQRAAVVTSRQRKYDRQRYLLKKKSRALASAESNPVGVSAISSAASDGATLLERNLGNSKRMSGPTKDRIRKRTKARGTYSQFLTPNWSASTSVERCIVFLLSGFIQLSVFLYLIT